MPGGARYHFSRVFSRRPGGLALALLLLPAGVAGCETQALSSSDKLFTTEVISVGPDPRAIAVADVNHHGQPDLVVVNANSRVEDGIGSISVLLGDGQGHFRLAKGSPLPAGRLPHDIGIGNFNGDGNVDLVVPNHQTPYVRLFLGDGQGGFREAPTSPLATKSYPHPHGVAVGHFCGKDKPLDVVTDSWGSGQIELLIGDGKGGLSNGPMFPAGPGTDAPLRSADFDHDGTPDIVNPGLGIGHWNANNVTVLLGDGKCGFQPAPGSPFPAGAEPWMVATGDMNHDGNADFVLIPYGAQVRDPGEIAATVLLDDGIGRFRPMTGSPFALTGCKNPGGVATGDFNGDGNEDFVVTCMASDNVLLFRGKKSGGFDLSSISVPGASGPLEERGVTLANLTGRGRDDIIIADPTTNSVSVVHWRAH